MIFRLAEFLLPWLRRRRMRREFEQANLRG